MWDYRQSCPNILNIYSCDIYIVFLVLKLKSLYEWALFIKYSSVNSLALCSGYRNRGWPSGRCWSLSFFHQTMQGLHQDGCKTSTTVDLLTLTALQLLFFWGLCLQLAELKSKDSLFQLHTYCVLSWLVSWYHLLGKNVYSENMTNVLETPDLNKTK